MRDLQLNGKGHVFSPTPMAGPGDAFGAAYEHILPQVDPIQVIRQRLWIIILVTTIFVGLAAGFSFWQTPTYQASVLVLVGQKQDKDVPTSLQGDVMGLQQIMETVAQAAMTEPIAKGAAQELGYSSPTLPGGVSAEVVEGTTFVQVSYVDSNPERAQRIANAVGDVLSKRISEVSPGISGLTATVWQEADVPGSPISPDPVRNVLLALFLGAMIGVGLAFLLDYLDDNWSSPEDVEKLSGVPTFGVIPKFNTRKIGKEDKGR